MTRKVMALLLVLTVAGAVAAPASAKRKPPKPAPATYYLNWLGDCSGAGFLSLKPEPNPDGCALFFPELGSSHSFGAVDGLPLTLAATDIAVDFELRHVATVAGEFQVDLTATVGGEQVTVGTATASVVAAGLGRTALHFDLAPDAALQGAKLETMTLTVSWTDGVSYSSVAVEEGTATMVVHRAK